MDQDDKKEFAKAKPYIIGIVALMYDLFQPNPTVRIEERQDVAFRCAEHFVAEFEKRN